MRPMPLDRNFAPFTEEELMMIASNRLIFIMFVEKYGKSAANSYKTTQFNYQLAIGRLISGDEQASYEASDLSEFLQGKPHLPEAHLDEYAIEHYVLILASRMQQLWRENNTERLQHCDYKEVYRHLPMALLAWEEIQGFVEISCKLFSILNVDIEREMLASAFYEYVAEFFYECGFQHASTFTDIMRELVDADIKTTGFSDIEKRYFGDGRRIKSLKSQFDRCGFGTVEQIQRFAKSYITAMSRARLNTELTTILQS